MKFLELEAAYIVIAIFILIITTIVSTRKFSPKNSFKKIFPVVFIILAILIAFHYNMTTTRMAEVEGAFLKGETIICENRTKKEFSKSIMINDNRGWNLKDNVFTNPEYFKGFHSARCVKMLENLEKRDKN